VASYIGTIIARGREGRKFFASPSRKQKLRREASSFCCFHISYFPLACLLIALAGGGCSTLPEAPTLATDQREAEIAVTNLTPFPWRIALRTAQGAAVKTVNVQPRESFAVVVAGGDYVVEQTLVTADPAAGTTRNFSARFEPGERYRWSLATLLSSEGPASP
jgi:hypothetical protein